VQASPPSSEGRISPRLRLQFALLLLVAWDAVGILAELSFGGSLFKVSGDKIDGILGARGAMGGALIVPLSLYVYALVRGPLRYRGLVWIGVLEQAMVVVFSLYHIVADDIVAEAAILPIVIALALLVVVLVNMPRGQTTS
jgi:hypothetical protein